MHSPKQYLTIVFTKNIVKCYDKHFKYIYVCKTAYITILMK